MFFFKLNVSQSLEQFQISLTEKTPVQSEVNEASQSSSGEDDENYDDNYVSVRDLCRW